MTKNLWFVLEIRFKRQISNLKDDPCPVPQSADLSTCGLDAETIHEPWMPCHGHLWMPPCSRLWAPQNALSSSSSLSHGLLWLLPVTWKLFATQGPQRPGDTRTNNSGHSSLKTYFLLCLCVFIIAPKPPERQRQAVSTFKLSINYRNILDLENVLLSTQDLANDHSHLLGGHFKGQEVFESQRFIKEMPVPG